MVHGHLVGCSTCSLVVAVRVHSGGDTCVTFVPKWVFRNGCYYRPVNALRVQF